jgi:hypothetical protein
VPGGIRKFTFRFRQSRQFRYKRSEQFLVKGREVRIAIECRDLLLVAENNPRFWPESVDRTLSA